MTSTELKMEYAERSSSCKLPHYLKKALEDDYVRNYFLYTDNTFDYIKVILLLKEETTALEMIELIRDDYCRSK